MKVGKLIKMLEWYDSQDEIFIVDPSDGKWYNIGILREGNKRLPDGRYIIGMPKGEESNLTKLKESKANYRGVKSEKYTKVTENFEDDFLDRVEDDMRNGWPNYYTAGYEIGDTIKYLRDIKGPRAKGLISALRDKASRLHIKIPR